MNDRKLSEKITVNDSVLTYTYTNCTTCITILPVKNVDSSSEVSHTEQSQHTELVIAIVQFVLCSSLCAALSDAPVRCGVVRWGPFWFPWGPMWSGLVLTGSDVVRLGPIG